jgi:transposase
MRSKGSAAQLEYRRQLDAKLLAQGKGVREIARWLEVAPSSISRWKQALERGGQQALRAKPHPGGQG